MLHDSIKKSIYNVLLLLFILLLVNCSHEIKNERFKINNTTYLITPSLHSLISPLSTPLPIENKKYKIPIITNNNKFGKEVDITPPRIMK